MSSGVRWAVGLTGCLVMTVMGSSSRVASRVVVGQGGQWSMVQAPAAALMQVWMGTPSGPVSPGTATVIAPLRRSRTAPSLQRQHAADADAHPAAAGHQDAGGLGGVEDRGGAVGLDAWLPEAKVTVPPSPASPQDDGAEALGGQLEAAVGVVRLEGVEQAGRAAGVGEAVVEVGHERGQPCSRWATSSRPSLSS